MPPTSDHSHPALDRPVTEFLSQAYITLREADTIDAAVKGLRAGTRTETPAAADAQAIYFYVLNADDQLVGILPARHLLLSPGDARVGDLMSRQVVALAERETLFDAMELFAIHRLLAIPVIDDRRHFKGIIELSLYTDQVYDMAQNRQLNEIFQLIGLDLEQHKQGSPLRGFRLRMPWLLANITGGLICAALGALFEATVQKVVILALFIPLILTLAESVSVQSMTLAIEQAASGRRAGIRREVATAALLGLCAGVIVGLVSLFWRGPLAATFTIAGAVAVAMVLAALLGRVIPQLMHLLRLNPRIASGPITLAVVDVVTVTVYLGGATMILGH